MPSTEFEPTIPTSENPHSYALDPRLCLFVLTRIKRHAMYFWAGHWGTFAKPLLAGETSKCVCVCSLSYPACKGHAPYYIVICGLSGSTIFYRIISQMALFSGKKLLNTKCVFWFSLHLLFENFLILRRIQRDFVVNVHRYSCKVPIIVHRFCWNLHFLYRVLKKKTLNVKFICS
jgi:hypothetical protein